MAKLTKKQATINGLIACGAKIDYARGDRSSRYTYYVIGEVTYLIGKGGAFRRTRTTVAESFSLTGTRLHAAYEYIGRIALSCELSAGQFRHLYVEVLRNGVPA